MPEVGLDVPETPHVRRRKINISLVWLVPVVAALVGLSMLVHDVLQAGPTLQIDFQTAEGIEANKTQVKYKNLVIGLVTAVELSEDRSHVQATVELNHGSDSFTAKDSKFWVVRPRIGATGVSGVETLLSGAFIGADAGSAKAVSHHFIGLETPPSVTYGEPGNHFMLHTADLGSLDIGSPVSYRRIQVGRVVSYSLDTDGKGVLVDIFVNSPYDRFVRSDTRFWNASGVNVSLNANGLKVDTQSVATILAGGIAFIEPQYSPGGESAAPLQRFELFDDQQTALARPDGKPRYFMMRFAQQLRGLTVGSPVEFLGVEIGRVVSIDLDYDPQTHTFPAVVGAVMYPERLGKAHEKILTQMGGDDDEHVARMIGLFIDKGLRAQVRTGNILTGQLYVSLDFMAKASPVAFDAQARPMTIPTAPGDLDKVQEQLKQVVDKIAKLPLQRIAENLDSNLMELNRTLRQVNGQVLPQMRETMSEAKDTLAQAKQSFAEDSPERQQLGQTLQEVQRTARSVRVLTDLLGRQPEALIRGRTSDGAADAWQSPTSISRPTAPEPQP